MEIDEKQCENYQRQLEALVHNRTEQLKQALDQLERLYSLLEQTIPHLPYCKLRDEVEELINKAKEAAGR